MKLKRYDAVVMGVAIRDAVNLKKDIERVAENISSMWNNADAIQKKLRYIKWEQENPEFLENPSYTPS